MTETEVEPKPSRPSRMRRAFGRWWIVGPLSIVLALVVIVVAFPLLVTPELVRRQLVSALTEDLGIDADIGGLDYHPLTGVELTDVQVRPPTGYVRRPLEVGRLTVRYSLWPLITGEGVVRKVVLEDAHVVLETQGGRTNLDAILASIARALGPAEPEVAPPDGPPSSLTPVAVRLETLAIGPVTLELAGEGPNAILSDVWLRGQGRLGTETLTASVALTVEPTADVRNFLFDLPAEGGATEGELTARMRLPVELEADSSAGFRLGRTQAALDLGLAGDVARSGRPLPPIDLKAGLTASIEPAAGQAAVPRLEVALDERTLLDGRATAEGLRALVYGLVAAPEAPGLADVLGLSADETPDRLEAEISILDLPLTELEPLAQAVLPGLVSVSGRASARDLRVAGSWAALLGGRPLVLTGQLATDRVKIEWPSVVMVETLDGGLTAGRDPDGRYQASGRFELSELDVAGQSLERGTLSLAAGVDQLDVATGATTATVTLSVVELASPPLTAKNAAAQVYLRGQDPLQPGRASTVPVMLAAAVQASDFRVSTVVSARRAEVSASVRADRLVDAARRPWTVEIYADADTLTVPSFQARSGRVSIAGTVGDVREAGYSTDLTMDGDFRRVESVGVTASRLVFDGALDVDDIRPRVRAGASAASTLPAHVGVELDARASRARYEGASTPVALSLDGGLDFDEGRLRVRSARVTVGRDARLALSGAMGRVFQRSKYGRLRARLQVPDLESVWSRVPVGLRGAAGDLQVQGAVRADVDVRGRLTSPWPKTIDWSKPPVQGRLRVATEEVALISDAMDLDVRGLTATVTAQLAPNAAVISPSIRLARYGTRDGTTVDGLMLDGSVALEQGVWRAATTARAVEVAAVLDGERIAHPASIDLSAQYVPDRDLLLERLDAQLPTAGLALHGRGRLRRDAQGDFTPELNLAAQVDVDVMSHLIPALESGDGRVGGDLRLVPGPSRTLAATGGLRATELSWRGSGWTLVDATGTVPIDQVLHLPAAAPLASAPPAGALGDDLEARLGVLGARLAAVQLVVDPQTDILAIAPRTADHYALGPYRHDVAAELVAREFRLGDTALTSLRAEARLAEGVLRVDRFQGKLWEGDLLFDLAAQVTPELDFKTRLRGTMTDLNLDLPYAKAKGIAPVTDPDEKAEYLASGVMDFEFALNQRLLEGQIDVVRLSKALVERLFGALDPSGKSSAAEALGYSEIAAVRPVAAKIWIAQNLLNVQFEWERVLGFEDFAPWWLAIDTVLFAPRIVSAWVLGGAWVIPTVNNSVKRASVFNWIDPYLGATFNETSALLAGFRARVVSSAELAEPGEALAE